MIEVSQAIPYRGIRKSIGKRMEISGAYPMTYQGMYVDVTELLAYRKQVNAKKGVSLTVNDFIVKAVSLALQRTPIMNSAFNEDMSQILVYSNYNISVMTGGPGDQGEREKEHLPDFRGDEGSGGEGQRRQADAGGLRRRHIRRHQPGKTEFL